MSGGMDVKSWQKRWLELLRSHGVRGCEAAGTSSRDALAKEGVELARTIVAVVPR